MSELLNFILDHEEAFKSRSRLASLYSDFQQQAATNPDGYNANITAWKRALVNAAKAGVLPSHGATADLLALRTGGDLSRELQSKDWGRPMALGAVIQDAVAKKEIIPLKEFLSSKTSIYHKSWIVTPWQVLGWGLRQLGVMGDHTPSDTLVEGSFVIVENLEAAANSILKQISSNPTSSVDLVYTTSTFLTEFGHILSPTHQLSPTDLSALLTHLSRDRQAVSFTPTTIKFAAPDSTAPPTPVTSTDATIASLHALIASHSTQIPLLTARISDLDAAARKAVAARSTAAARVALRQKKMAEAALEQRSKTLAQLEEVFGKIEAAASNVEILRVMEASAGVLKGLNKEVGGAEGAERVVERLREEMDKVDEVSGLVNEVGADRMIVDEGEVEDEFEALEREESERKEKIEREAREKVEREEAEKTRKRLEELEELEREGKVKELERKKLEGASAEEQGSASEEPDLKGSIQGLNRMSLDELEPNSASRNEETSEERGLVPAS